MQGDFSRVTFDRDRHFSAVLSQQGRVQLDSEINEQTAILQYYLRTLVADVLGPAACPAGPQETDPGGFRVAVNDGVLTVTHGRMYVDGILCECKEGAEYWSQPDGYLDQERQEAEGKLHEGPFLAYLRVWERLVTAHEAPELREPALGLHGPDTTARTRVVWQIDWFPLSPGHPVPDPAPETAQDWLAEELTARFGPRAELAARARLAEGDTDPCDVAPDSGYRGPENQLYRVEVHRGGTVGRATFKWSRENGSVVLPIRSVAGPTLELDTLGRDNKLGLEPGDTVEIVDDASVCRAARDVAGRAPRLYRITEVDHVGRRVVLDAAPAADAHHPGLGTLPERHPLLRRWDHRPPEPATGPAGGTAGSGSVATAVSGEGALLIEEGRWLPIEDGIEVLFEPVPQSAPAAPATPATPAAPVDPGAPPVPPALPEPPKRSYRAGDYWLIPARVVTGDVLWPADANGDPQRRAPHGIDYHYAPLAKVEQAGADGARTPEDLRKVFRPLAQPLPPL
ncbi:DUF6519 domain-containing protein [Streptomyces sp. NBC_01233]|uniref:DUF6519 domain-containing protein n=1 Tax=Streptomyces sp. NBC_01233 TaxID=2903787 RepID=UPI002E0E9863|nr:DUF4815 domain-containing protein [Streptomyces sp. NBC_01233]